MKYFQKIGSGLSIMPLLSAVTRQPELWNQNRLRTTHEYTPHSQVDDIWLRFNDLQGAETRQEVLDQHESVDYPAFALLPQARPLIFDLMRFTEAKRLGRVIITRLAPGKQIDPHVDSGDHASYYDRYHITLKNQPGSIFTAGNETVIMMPGDIWWFDNQAEHSVINNSCDDRITMIVDMRSK